MDAIPDLSIVLDMETLKITGALIFDGQIKLWRDAADKIAPRTYELIICSSLPLDEKIEFPPRIKMVISPGLGYYAMKNAGEQTARGKIIFFGDVDCRPVDNYFVRLLHYFDASNANIIGGRTFYDGSDFRTRASSVTSWGYLHQVETLPPGSCLAGHNLAIRKGFVEKPFGPYTERYGGDEYITETFRRKGEKILIKQDLIIYHESPAHSFRGLMDRHLRELARITFVKYGQKISPILILKEAFRHGRNRWRLFKRQAPKFGIGRNQKWRGWLLFHFYLLLDVLVAVIMILNPRTFSRWVHYQFGDLDKCTPVGIVLARHSGGTSR
jgi:hypothetical protein